MMIAAQRRDGAEDLVNDDDPRVIDLLDMRAKADVAGDRQRVARAEWCLEWLAFKRYANLRPDQG